MCKYEKNILGNDYIYNANTVHFDTFRILRISIIKLTFKNDSII